MKDFNRFLFLLKAQYHFTFTFYQTAILKRILKVLTIAIFIIPSTLLALITLIIGWINILFWWFPFVGWIGGLFNVLTLLSFRLCNLSEVQEYKSNIHVIMQYI